MARSLKQDRPDRAAKIVAWATGELETAQTAEMKHHFLLVLGNAGAPEALPAIQKSLTDKDSGVRAAAVGALRFIDSDQAEALLTKVLGSDSEPQVRAETIRAFACRSKTQRVFEACAKALQSDDSKSVRLASLNLMWQCRQKFPQVVSLVENTAKNDPADDVRKRAGELLENELPE
jgi:HEAT repeat protein